MTDSRNEIGQMTMKSREENVNFVDEYTNEPSDGFGEGEILEWRSMKNIDVATSDRVQIHLVGETLGNL